MATDMLMRDNDDVARLLHTILATLFMPEKRFNNHSAKLRHALHRTPPSIYYVWLAIAMMKTFPSGIRSARMYGRMTQMDLKISLQ
eukprot:scaffold680004_cov62-Prasinocladus_malaysianus.AAC.1